MMPTIAYTCPVCGAQIRHEQTEPDFTADQATDYKLRIDSTLRHDGPMDAACRLVFEALTDEIRDHQQQLLNHITEQMTETLRQRP